MQNWLKPSATLTVHYSNKLYYWDARYDCQSPHLSSHHCHSAQWPWMVALCWSQAHEASHLSILYTLHPVADFCWPEVWMCSIWVFSSPQAAYLELFKQALPTGPRLLVICAVMINIVGQIVLIDGMVTILSSPTMVFLSLSEGPSWYWMTTCPPDVMDAFTTVALHQLLTVHGEVGCHQQSLSVYSISWICCQVNEYAPVGCPPIMGSLLNLSLDVYVIYELLFGL